MSIFGVILVRIQSKCGKIRTRVTPNTETFHAVISFLKSSDLTINHDMKLTFQASTCFMYEMAHC